MTARRFATPEPTICAVCRRHAVWIGYSPNNQPPIWLCGATECSSLAERVYSMKSHILDAYEHGARIEAGQYAGAYLDECGTADLAELPPDQWDEFCTRFILAYEKAMIRKIQGNEPPF